MTAWVEQLVRNMGYIGLALLTFIENIFPPIPSEVIIPLGGYLTTQQENMNIIGVILAGTVGSIVGAIALYYLGYYFHADRLRSWAEKHGHWLLLDPEDIDKAEKWFGNHGPSAVFLCRMIPGVRSLISVPAGSSGMHMLPFLLYTTLGTAIWTAALAYAGSVLGQNYSDIGTVIEWATYIVIASIIGTIVWWVVRKRRQQHASANSPS